MKKAYLLLVFLAAATFAAAQEDFYDPARIQEIRIIFSQKNWKHVMDSVFLAGHGENRVRCDVRINGQLLEGAGIRYKGYSSVDTAVVKNPFNIDLAYSVKNKNYEGFTSLRLSNVNYDPSFIREALSYEIARKYMPASRANFANVYINDTLVGLYSNVEAVNDEFVSRFFGSNGNSFIKGSPAKLEYPFGQNANLANTHGTDSAKYEPYYSLESGSGWSDLYHFISVLNEQPDSAAGILNVDRALWMHAFNYTLVNLDSYIGYAQNYYLYLDDAGRFNPIPWDMNMSFGSFRNSDASYHFGGLTVAEAALVNPTGLLDFAVSPRPLITKLIRNDTLKRMFLAHMRTILDENIRSGEYFTRGQALQETIDPAVAADPNKFYPYAEFHENLIKAVGTTGSEDEFPGIKSIMETRMAYLDTLEGFSGEPEISRVGHDPALPVPGEPVWITAKVSGAARVLLGYRFSSSGRFLLTAMADDGSHHDGEAGDGVYGAMLTTGGHTIRYYVYAENDSAGTFSPPGAEYECYTIQAMISPGDVVINEVFALPGMANWIELLNTTPEPLDISGMQLSDDPQAPGKVVLGEITLGARKYLVVDPSGDSAFIPSSAFFSLAAGGGTVILANDRGIITDQQYYTPPVNDRSTGRYPNGYGAMTLMKPTRGAYNATGSAPSSGFRLYPNPAQNTITVETHPGKESYTIAIYTAEGTPVMAKTLEGVSDQAGDTAVTTDVSALGSGLYLVRVVTATSAETRKLIIL